MAAKRVTTSAVNWGELANKVPAAQKPLLNAFKSKHNGYLGAVNVLPEALPKIDFDSYKGKINVPGMVEDFQKKYEGLAIPYPADTMSAAIDAEAAQLKANYEAFVVESKAKIEKIKTDMAAWENMKPIEHMTCEEVLAYPQLADHPVIQAHIQNPDRPRHRQLETYYDEWVHEGWFPSQHHEFEEYEEQLYGPHGPFPEAVGTVGKLDEQVPYDPKHVPAGANADYMAKLAAK